MIELREVENLEGPAPLLESPQTIAEESSGRIELLVTALAAAQAMIRNPIKDKTAKVTVRDGGAGYSYTYADLASVLDVARAALAPNKLALLQFPATPDARTLRLRTVLAHGSGQWVAAVIQTTVADARPQSLGSAITYLRRYSIQSLLGITAEDDDDANRAQGLEARTEPRPVPPLVVEDPATRPAAPEGAVYVDRLEKRRDAAKNFEFADLLLSDGRPAFAKGNLVAYLEAVLQEKAPLVITTRTTKKGNLEISKAVRWKAPAAEPAPAPAPLPVGDIPF